jgi:hypothetical protein
LINQIKVNYIYLQAFTKAIDKVPILKSASKILALSGLFFFSCIAARAQITIYQPQPYAFGGDTLKFRAAFSISSKQDTVLRFGSFQASALMETDKNNRTVKLHEMKVHLLSFSGNADKDSPERLEQALEAAMPADSAVFSLDVLISSLSEDAQAFTLREFGELSYIPPRIIVSERSSILIVTDGPPRLKWNHDWGLNVVVNTPYLIAESPDGWYYLYGGRHWYTAPEFIGPYHTITYTPPDMYKAQKAIDHANAITGQKVRSDRPGIVPEVVLSTEPAELIQTSGRPIYSAVPGTSLSFVANSDNDIFLDSVSHRYYVLLSGRWFTSPEWKGKWTFIAADSLPGDFARIPEGSAKGQVLSSVAGTDLARESIVEARIPQTGRIDRNSTADTVVYEKEPKFISIRNTGLQYAVNTPDIVLKDVSHYYFVDKGVWFRGEGPAGPWTVATERPSGVERIPPDYPVYVCKYVYIYDVSPGYVYAGFTAGYLNAFVDGPTLVYGTGYAYHSWLNSNYYPRSTTWGFNIRYDPWFEWCFGYDYPPDWFNPGVAWGLGFWTGGWWGPAVFRPPYIWPDPFHYKLNEKTLSGNIFTDQAGGIYRRGRQGNWERREGERWTAIDPLAINLLQNLDRQELLQYRGRLRQEHFRQLRAYEEK